MVPNHNQPFLTVALLASCYMASVVGIGCGKSNPPTGTAETPREKRATTTGGSNLSEKQLAEFRRQAEEVETLKAAGELEDALECQRKLVERVEAACGVRDTNTAIQKMNLAWLLQESGQVDHAELLLLDSLDTLNDTVGPRHRYVATNIRNLIDLYILKEDDDQARVFENRLAIQDR